VRFIRYFGQYFRYFQAAEAAALTVHRPGAAAAPGLCNGDRVNLGARFGTQEPSLSGRVFAAAPLRSADSNATLLAENRRNRAPWFLVRLEFGFQFELQAGRNAKPPFLQLGQLQFHLFYGDDFKVECPTGSGRLMTLFEVAERAFKTGGGDLLAKRRRQATRVWRRHEVSERPPLA
jgi:hypothetical protein